MKDRDKLHKNAIGGVNDMDKGAIDRARKTDLVTLPKDVTGTNCFNCRYIKDQFKGIGYCKNPSVLQYVNARMCCALWDRIGAYRPFKKMI